MNKLKHAFRQLALRPGLSATVIVMLALGIGATTGIFTLFHDILLQPLPVPEPDRLVALTAPGGRPGVPRTGLAVSDWNSTFSYPAFRELESRQEVFTGLAAHYDFLANLDSGERATFGRGVLVSGGYFEVLGVRPALGRLIGPQDAPSVGESEVAVLSYEYWQRQLGGDPRVLNTTLAVNGRNLTIVGVAAEGFEGAMLGWRPEVYVPITMRWAMQPEEPRNDENRLSYWLYVLARLKPGISLEQASASMNVRYSEILREDAAAGVNLTEQQRAQLLETRLVLAPGARGQSSVTAQTAAPLTFLLGITALVLLIVCVNIANLLLARGTARAGELAIRRAVGANRARLVVQLLAESAMLAALGALLSVPVAIATVRLIVALAPGTAATRMELSPLTWPVLGFVAAAALVTVLLFGLAPAIRATRTDLAPALKGQTAQSQGGRGVARFSRLLIMAQITFATLLLVLAGLFSRSLVNVARVELGMNMDSVASFSVSPLLGGYAADQLDEIYDRIQEELAAQPGVVSVGSAALPILQGFSLGAIVEVVGGPELSGNNYAENNLMVSPRFFESFSIPLLAGRDFTDADRTGPPVAIVNRAFVEKFQLGSDAVGKTVRLQGPYVPTGDTEIIGVVPDTRFARVKGQVSAQFFTPRPRGNTSFGSLFFFVRGARDADSLLSMIPRVVAGVDPNLPVGNPTTVKNALRGSVAGDRIITTLSTTLAVLAIVLAAIGLYGALAYNVAQRTRELGLRLALGAEPSALRAIVLKQVGWMALIGGALGLALALVVGRVVRAFLYGLSTHDPAAIGGAIAILAAVALGAAYVPARRASNVAPLEALRYE
jgi:predicted permease